MASDTSRYPSGYASPNPDKGMNEDQLKELLERLISSSEDLNVRVWLDGVYTDVESTRIPSDWMNGREVYFKVEGRVDRLKNGAAQ
ncbi:MAG TPA: hypothetical protein VE955_12610 [Candidatus Dormibacteraeota bacterium]|nr:hypothetical protein [Candidatus Dormibacteraeota bacterium]